MVAIVAGLPFGRSAMAEKKTGLAIHPRQPRQKNPLQDPERSAVCRLVNGPAGFIARAEGS